MPRLLLAAVVLLTLLAVPGSALAAHVRCGDVITEDTTLDADVVCGPGEGVAAPDGQLYALLIGANGVKLDLGGHSVLGMSNLAGHGYEIFSVGVFGHDHVTIANGGMREQLTLSDADRGQLLDLRLSAYASSALTLDGSRRNVIRRVEAHSDWGGAMRLLDGSNGNTVANGSFGAEPWGILIRDSHRNRVRHNTIGGYNRGLAIERSHDTVVSHNDLSAGGSYAIAALHVAAGSRRTLVRQNLAHDSYYDGILVEDPSTRLIRNTANDNGDLGIEAVLGTVGRGNRASGNVNPLQCTGVTCE